MRTREKGQALLIILLVMSVVLTVAISVVSRSITDIAVSQKEEEAARAFSAAEAGVERALLSGGSDTGIVGGDSFTTSVSGLLGGANFILPQKLASGETLPVWFIEHSGNSLVCDSNNPCFEGDYVTFHWGEDGTSANSPTTPALEGIILYTTGSSGSSPDPATARIARVALDPNQGRGNSFDAPRDTSCDLPSAQFEFCLTISLSSLGVTDRTTDRTSSSYPRGAHTVRIRLLYNTDRTHPVAVSVPVGSLPSQGLKIDSSGTAGEATRRIEVYRLFADLPPVFDFAAFSGATGITK